jgi:predicted peroxiredoxin
MAAKLIVRITHGPDDAERAVTGLTVASAALASGVEVEVWLNNDGVWLAVPGVAETMSVPAAPPPIELWAQIAAGASVFACTQCLARRGIEASSLRDGVVQAGAAAFVASVAEADAREISF